MQQMRPVAAGWGGGTGPRGSCARRPLKVCTQGACLHKVCVHTKSVPALVVRPHKACVHTRSVSSAEAVAICSVLFGCLGGVSVRFAARRQHAIFRLSAAGRLPTVSCRPYPCYRTLCGALRTVRRMARRWFLSFPASQHAMALLLRNVAIACPALKRHQGMARCWQCPKAQLNTGRLRGGGISLCKHAETVSMMQRYIDTGCRNHIQGLTTVGEGVTQCAFCHLRFPSVAAPLAGWWCVASQSLHYPGRPKHRQWACAPAERFITVATTPSRLAHQIRTAGCPFSPAVSAVCLGQ
eukprot:309113-Chlamydomonas_euryale.AAC.5